VQLVTLRLEQQLRRGADDLELRRTDEERVWARVDAPKRSIQADAVERTPGRRVGREIERLAARAEDDLIASPAAIASLATSTARMYSSRPRLVSMGSLSAGAPLVRVGGPASSAALGRAVRSSASKMASSAIR
jgi:hypothetical protein